MKSNLDIIDSLTKVSCINICTLLGSRGNNDYLLAIEQHPAKWMVEQHLLSCVNGKSIRFVLPDSASSTPELNIIIRDISVSYQLHPESRDSLVREIKSVLNGKLTYGNNIEPIMIESRNYRDTISRDDIPFVQNSQYPFAAGELPEPPTSFYHEIAQPAIIITSALVTLILLFTVRSK